MANTQAAGDKGGEESQGAHAQLSILGQEKRVVFRGESMSVDEYINRYFTLQRMPDGSWVAPNIGVFTGAPSGGLMDVDCDAPEAVEVAALLLPELLPITGCVSGHASKPYSHYWYTVAGGMKTMKFSLSLARVGPDGTSTRSPTMLIELRGDGHQTMIPPSIHPSGEEVVWYREGEPARVSADELRTAIAVVAAGAAVARYWPGQGSRDDTALALCGMLARGGWDADRIDTFVRAVARVGKDEEWKQRGKGRPSTAELAAGRPVTGAPRLAELLGPEGEAIVAKVREWLKLPMGERTSQSPRRSAGREDTPPTENTYVEPLIAAAEVTPTPVLPLFGGRLYFGKLALCDGDPGLGKTLVALDLAARLSAGREMPDGSRPEGSGNVLYFSAEDDPADTLRPRLEAAGGDLRRVYFVTTARLVPPGASEPVTRLPTFRDVALLAHYIAQTQARLVIFDPFMAYLDAGANAFRDQDVRGILAPLAVLAEQSQAAVLFIRHLNKSGGARALYRGGGSIGIIGAVRAAWLIGRDPNATQGQVLASTKNNLGALPPSLAYRIISTEDRSPVVQWAGATACTADMLVAGPDQRADTLEAATAMLTALLQAGPMPENEVHGYADEHGISAATLRRAKASLGVESNKRGGHEGREGAQWWWSLPLGEAPAS